MVRVILPAAAGLAVVSVVTGRDLGVDQELHVTAPAAVEQAQTLPVRAHLYGQLDAPEGPRLIQAPIALELRSDSGRPLQEAALRPSFANTAEAVLQLPAAFRGSALLTVRSGDERTVVAELPLRVSGRPPAPLSPQPRPLRVLQQQSAGPLRALDPQQPAPDSLQVQVSGGACVPEHPCELWVHVGEPAAAVYVEPTASVQPLDSARQPSAPTSWAVPMRVVTRGAEAELTLRAERAGTAVAQRRVRLPVAQASYALAPTARVWRAPALVEAGLLGLSEAQERGCIVDAFRDGRWVATGTLPECHGDEPLPLPALGAGLWRLQLRRDPFASDSAAVRSLWVLDRQQDEREALATLASRVRARFPDDPLARALDAAALAALPQAELRPVAGYLLAALDEGVIALPRPVSSYPRSLLSLERTRARVRMLALVVVLLCAVTLGLLLARRGMRASDQAARIMTQAGEAPAALDRQQKRRLLAVLATVASLLLAFVAIAMYILARSGSL